MHYGPKKTVSRKQLETKIDSHFEMIKEMVPALRASIDQLESAVANRNDEEFKMRSWDVERFNRKMITAVERIIVLRNLLQELDATV